MPAEGRLVAEQLQRVDRLAAAADQQPVVLVADDGRLDALLALIELDLTIEIELVEDALEQHGNPLTRLLRPLLLGHAPTLNQSCPRTSRRPPSASPPGPGLLPGSRRSR